MERMDVGDNSATYCSRPLMRRDKDVGFTRWPVAQATAWDARFAIESRCY